MLSLDLTQLLNVVFTAIAIVVGFLLLVNRAASRFFAVDEAFEPSSAAASDAGYYYKSLRRMSIGGGDETEGACSAGCGRLGNKRCSGCKRVSYCSTTCQSAHWQAEHKVMCKQLRLLGKVAHASSGDDAYRRRKSSISLVPAHGSYKVLREPKKLLFPYDEFVRLFNWDKPGFPPCGLFNCGNSCFANVVLQCLACTRPLAAYLLEKDHNRTCIRKQDDWCFLCELQAHIQRASVSRQPFSPVNILYRIPNIGGNLGCGSQEDAHEFMRFAIDTMQSVCLDEFGGEKALDPSTQETSLIQYIFGGHLQSQVKCMKCNMISNRYENMMDLTVEIHGDAESLEECLEQFTVKEWLDGDNMYKCDGCNGYVKAWKRLTVHQAPNALTIALKRFQSGRFGKLNKRVTFPEELDLSPYMNEGGDGGNLYSLYAVVVHVDMLNASFFGHYICYTKDYCGRWYRIDDCEVIVVDVEEVLSQGAYMLLYSRKTARKEPFVRPRQPAVKKHLVSKDITVANVSKGENVSSEFASSLPSTESGSNGDLPSFSSNMGLESKPSLLRDTGHDRLTDIKTDTLKGNGDSELEVVRFLSGNGSSESLPTMSMDTGHDRLTNAKTDAIKGKEDSVSEVPAEVLLIVDNDLGDINIDDSSLNLSAAKGCEESSTQPSMIQEENVFSQIDTISFSTATPVPTEVHEMECEATTSCEESSNQHSEKLKDKVITSQAATDFISPAITSFAEVQYVERDEPVGISVDNPSSKDNGSVCIIEEVAHMARSPSECSFYRITMVSNTDDNMHASSLNLAASSSFIAAESSGDYESKPEQSRVEHNPLLSFNGVDQLPKDSCRNGGTKASPLVSQNGKLQNSKPLSSCRFLEKGPETTQTETTTSKVANGYSNVQSGFTNGAHPAQVIFGAEALNDNSSIINEVFDSNKENGFTYSEKDELSILDEERKLNSNHNCLSKLTIGHVRSREFNKLPA